MEQPIAWESRSGSTLLLSLSRNWPLYWLRSSHTYRFFGSWLLRALFASGLLHVQLLIPRVLFLLTPSLPFLVSVCMTFSLRYHLSSFKSQPPSLPSEFYYPFGPAHVALIPNISQTYYAFSRNSIFICWFPWLNKHAPWGQGLTALSPLVLISELGHGKCLRDCCLSPPAASIHY